MNINIKQCSHYLAAFLMFIAITVNAEHAQLTWTWQLDRAMLNDSVVSISIDGQAISHYEFSCDLSDALLETEEDESSATIDSVVTDSNPEGLLVVTCMFGAHSEQISIIDPFQNKRHAEFSKVGSYFVDWHLNDDQLWIKYDESCEKKDNDVCDVPFLTVEMPWPVIKE